MSLNSKAHRAARKKREAEKTPHVNPRQFYVAVNPKSGDPFIFDIEDGVSSTYAAVGKAPEIVKQLTAIVSEQQGVTSKAVPLNRTIFYMASLIKLPALGLDLIGLVGPAGLEIIPLSVKGIEWLKTHHFAAPDLTDPMEVMVYSAGRIATLEFNKPFSSLAEISEAIPVGVVQSMASVAEMAPADLDEVVKQTLN